jgi:hypothetical protein
MGLFGRKDWNIIAVVFQRADLYQISGQRAKGGDADKARDGAKNHSRTIYWGVYDQKGTLLESGPGQGAINSTPEAVKGLEREMLTNRGIQEILKTLSGGKEDKVAKPLSWTGYPRKS